MTEDKTKESPGSRRKFIKRCMMGGCGLALGAYAIRDLFVEGVDAGLRVGFRNDAPSRLWKWSKEAQWYTAVGSKSALKIHCHLCPHECILGEQDRGFCRTRVVKEGRLYSMAYGNPCAVHIDPVEKKPLFHFLPGSQILSVATAGCNLRCLNCQNWQISQYKPEQTTNYDLLPSQLVQQTLRREIPSIAYTYSEPIIFYEYVYDSALLGKEQGLRNVLVTAGYILPDPLRKLCKVIDAANVDLKCFSNEFYKKVSGATLAPVLKALKIMREEGVWIEVTNLIVPTLSDDFNDIRSLVKWIFDNLGPETPLHFSRFHPAYRLRGLPLTPVDVLKRAREIALEVGLRFVYIGNVPTHDGENTVCPKCGKIVIRRRGYNVWSNDLRKGVCSCGELIPGVWI
jgi:pyruvate formate lyase activating enzyme